jgi:hypothetical protein
VKPRHNDLEATEKLAPRGSYVFSMRDACAELRLSLPSVNELVEKGTLETYMLGARRFTTATAYTLTLR